MKQLILIIYILLSLFLSAKAQNFEEISQLAPFIPYKPTKAELKTLKNFRSPDGKIFGAPIKVFVGVETKILQNGKKVSVITAKADSYDLTFKETDNEAYLARINFFGKITSNDKKIDGIFEDEISFTLKKEQMGKPTPILYKKIFELPEGKYTIRLFTRDIQNGNIGIESISFEIK